MSIKAQPVPNRLPPGLAERLAPLYGKRSDVAELALSEMRGEDLRKLESLGMIKTFDAASRNADAIHITEYGRGVIAGCAAQFRRTGPRQVFGDL